MDERSRLFTRLVNELRSIVRTSLGLEVRAEYEGEDKARLIDREGREIARLSWDLESLQVVLNPEHPEFEDVEEFKKLLEIARVGARKYDVVVILR